MVTNFTQPLSTSVINTADNLVGFQGDFTFDSSVIGFQDPPISATGLTSTNWNVTGNVLPGSGLSRTLRITAFSNDSIPLSGSGTLLSLNMTRVTNTLDTQTALTWSAAPNNLIFVDANLHTYAPGSTPVGSISVRAVSSVYLPIATVGTSATNFVQNVVVSAINPADNLIGFQGDFSFDSSVVTFSNPQVSPAGLTANNWNVSSNILNTGPGTMKVLRISAYTNDGFTPLTGSGTLFQLNMTRVSNVSGATTALVWAPDPNNLFFIDSDLISRLPGNTPPGSITVEMVAAVSLPTGGVNTAVTNFIQPVTTSAIDPADNLIGFQGDFTFDSAVVTFSTPRVSAAGLTANNWNVSSNILNTGPGTTKVLRISAYTSDGVTPLSGSGTLFALNMVRVSNTPGAVTALVWRTDPNDFYFIDTDLNDRRPSTAPPGSISIQGFASISGSISYCSNPLPGPVPNVTLSLTGGASSSILSDGSGNYLFSSLVGGGTFTVTPTKNSRTPGSVGINTVDVIAAQRHFLNVAPIPAGCRLTAADANGDTAINVIDVIAIQRFAIGMTTGTANVGKYQFSPTSRTYPALGNDQTSQSYNTLVFGDVASPFVE